ncbi:sulfotransferase [Verrucomicrobiota bacterium]
MFGIGLGRTGTKSLTEALEQLGFRTKHCPRFFLDDEARPCIDWADFDSHDALTDEGVALVYQEADRRYPGSKFILTMRDPEDWLRSRYQCLTIYRCSHFDPMVPGWRLDHERRSEQSDIG